MRYISWAQIRLGENRRFGDLMQRGRPTGIFSPEQRGRSCYQRGDFGKRVESPRTPCLNRTPMPTLATRCSARRR